MTTQREKTPIEREKMPVERPGLTRTFRVTYTDEIDNQVKQLQLYVTANTYADGRIGEIFVRGDKVGGLVGGVLDTMCIMFSVAVQHGIPMTDLTSKMRHQSFGPSGRTGEQTFPSCSSLVDLLAQWLEYEFPNGKRRDKTEGRPRDPTDHG